MSALSPATVVTSLEMPATVLMFAVISASASISTAKSASASRSLTIADVASVFKSDTASAVPRRPSCDVYGAKA